MAATQVERPHLDGDSIEILDLRTLAPYDWPAIRALGGKDQPGEVAHEDCLSWGYGAESPRASPTSCSPTWMRPSRRVGALDTWVGYHPQLKPAILLFSIIIYIGRYRNLKTF